MIKFNFSYFFAYFITYNTAKPGLTMSKKLTWIIAIFCAFFTAHSFADEISYAEVKTKFESILAKKMDTPSVGIELMQIYASVPSKHAQRWFKDLLYKDFFFHRAAQDCYVPLVNFFLDQIVTSREIDEYLLRGGRMFTRRRSH